MSRYVPAWVVFLIYLALAVAAQEAHPAPVDVPPDSVQPLLFHKVAPIYPPLPRQARIQGTVILKIVITKLGDVGDVTLFSGHPMLAPAAIEAVKQWKYRPYEKDGEPVDIRTTVQVNFKLADNPPPPSGVVGSVPGGIPHTTYRLPQVHACDNSPESTAPKRVRVSSGVMQALMTSKERPKYPEDARNQHIEGVVVLDVEIGKDGAVCDVALISGHPMLAQAAIDAVRSWKYRPYLLNGEPIEVETSAQVNFTLTP